MLPRSALCQGTTSVVPMSYFLSLPKHQRVIPGENRKGSPYYDNCNRPRSFLPASPCAGSRKQFSVRSCRGPNWISWPLGSDPESPRPRISFLDRNPAREGSGDSTVCQPLGQRPPTPQDRNPGNAHHLRLAQGRGRPQG